MYCDLWPYVLWPLHFQIQKRIVSAETIWGNTVFKSNFRFRIKIDNKYHITALFIFIKMPIWRSLIKCKPNSISWKLFKIHIWRIGSMIWWKGTQVLSTLGKSKKHPFFYKMLFKMNFQKIINIFDFFQIQMSSFARFEYHNISTDEKW